MQETPLERLRLSSLDPLECLAILPTMQTYANRICPHIHIALQSPLDSILRRMKRRYSAQDAIKALQATQGLYVGIDIITGFPGESTTDFQETYNLMQDLPWTRLHVFPYSERSGTPATRLPNSVPLHERAGRRKTLTELSMKRQKSLMMTIQSTRTHLDRVLWEQPKDGWQSGHTPEYLRVLLPQGAHSTPGSVSSVRIIDQIYDRASADISFLGSLS